MRTPKAAPICCRKCLGSPCPYSGLAGAIEQAFLRLSKHPLDNLLLGSSSGKSPHVKKICAREALHFRESHTQVAGEPVNDFCPPPLRRPPGQDAPPDLPIQPNQFVVHSQRGARRGCGFSDPQACWGKGIFRHQKSSLQILKTRSGRVGRLQSGRT